MSEQVECHLKIFFLNGEDKFDSRSRAKIFLGPWNVVSSVLEILLLVILGMVN